MSDEMDEMDFPGIPAREDCSSCPETGTRCALHENMYHRALKRQQETGLVVPTEQANGDRDDGQPAHGMSKRAVNRVKTQEGQVISALKRMNFVDGKQRHNLSKKQKIRDRKQGDAAAQVPNPAKMAAKQEKAAKRAADPERIARLEARRQNMAEKKAVQNARRLRLVDEQRQKNKTSRLVDAADTNDALQLARSLEQKHATDDKAQVRGPARRTRGQIAAYGLHTELQDLATVHSMPLDTGTGDFLARADSLIQQTLNSVHSTLSPTDRKNLEEALSLVRTTHLLSPSHTYNPMNLGFADESIDRVIHGPIADDPPIYGYRPIIEGQPIKQEPMAEDTSIKDEENMDSHGRLRGGASFVSTEQDSMME
ncbi:hypothetical protein D6C80_06723 [Aureobasidium pullulans]|nr:hypothetical protein D6C80_06723 [Aureobasidium pullulans]